MDTDTMIRITSSDATVTYLDPTAGPGAPAEPYEPRLSTKSPRIALVSNNFSDATHFLDDLREPLSRILPGVIFIAFDKNGRRNSSYPLALERIAEIADQADAVICAFGHCGSCTAGTVRDTVAFARRGKPAIALVTQKFEEEAAFVSRAAGIPGVPIVVLPHPTAGREPEFHRALAEAIAPLIVRGLTRGEKTNAVHILETAPQAVAA